MYNTNMYILYKYYAREFMPRPLCVKYFHTTLQTLNLYIEICRNFHYNLVTTYMLV